jgi:hypothetical protein
MTGLEVQGWSGRGLKPLTSAAVWAILGRLKLKWDLPHKEFAGK